MDIGRIGLVLALTVTMCAQTSAAEDAYSTATEQASALGEVLAGVRTCEGDAWEAPFHEFMAAKRKRGLTDEQTAMLAALVGGAESGAEPDMLECTAEGQTRRAAAIEQMRSTW